MNNLSSFTEWDKTAFNKQYENTTHNKVNNTYNWTIKINLIQFYKQPGVNSKGFVNYKFLKVFCGSIQIHSCFNWTWGFI